jgi:PKD repeat protein
MANSAGTCTITEETFGSFKKIKWNWTCGSGTKVDSITTPTTTYAYDGKIEKLVTVGAAGSSAPSNDFDITINDQSSIDVLMGAGGSRATTTQYTKGNSMGIVCNDTLTLTITAAGSSNAGATYLYIR